MERIKKSPCTCMLIAVNVIVFLILSMFGRTEDAGYMMTKGAMYMPDILQHGKYYELFTSMFLHFGIEHLLSNMVVLAWGGVALERAAGSVKMLVIYLISGVGGNILSGYLEMQTWHYTVGAGASGAIFGVTGALLYIVIRNRGSIYGVTRRSIVIMILLNLYLGFTSEGVNNAAHIGGLICGFILAVLLYHKRKQPSYKRKSAGLHRQHDMEDGSV